MKVSKGAKLGLGTQNVEQFIAKYSQRIPIKNTPKKQNIIWGLGKKGKPICTYKGIENPVKLNISQDTLNKIKKN